ncbi:RDD family protein [Streptomyces sp. HMX112]|uniref:RDD family protein n=1 Tax=Streptomyces sp. HMX112 TaxID=3390850 RepID=UPI003A80CE8E
MLAVALDLALALFLPSALAGALDGRQAGEQGPVTGTVLVIGIPLVSFVNQVVLTVLFRASAGKLLTGIRVIRASDGGRPGFWRTVRRWLSGLCWLPLQPWYWLRSLARDVGRGRAPARGTVADNDDGELYGADLSGLRYARRKDLRTHGL